MPIEMLASLTLLGAIVGLDMVSFPQAMLSRPIVGSTLAGAVCGNTMAGLVVGVLLECFALETMPFGASRYPEWGPASVAAGVLAALPGADGARVLHVAPFAVLAGLVTAMLAGETLVWLRRFNAASAARHHDAIAAGDSSAILGLQWTGLAVDFLRGGVVTLVFVVALVPVRDVLELHASVAGASPIAVLAVVAIGVAGAAFWKVVHTTVGYAWWLLAGLLGGCTLLVLT